ncbi:hypothetical protein [Neoroseomonas rubea]|uniref:hypothetical protein n=1 Tax=Neoroseomonas rubea TaxID=2748666 RepID=UPI0018DEFBA3|nr:hypothetical protein [Roseomonas rubea]
MTMTMRGFIALGALAVALPIAAQTPPTKATGDAAITEMQRQQANPGIPAVPEQNREGAMADARDADWVDTRQWLDQARAAVNEGNLGLANELLERAATRMLSRSVVPSMAAQPMHDARLRHITLAREAVQRRDRGDAVRQIDLAIAPG